MSWVSIVRLTMKQEFEDKMNKISKFLNWVGDISAKAFGGKDKEHDLVAGIIGIVTTVALILSAIFGIISWLTGIPFWIMWVIGFVLYLLSVGFYSAWRQ